MQDKTLSLTKEEEKGGRVSSLAWYQPVLMFRSVVSRFGSETVDEAFG